MVDIQPPQDISGGARAAEPGSDSKRDKMAAMMQQWPGARLSSFTDMAPAWTEQAVSTGVSLGRSRGQRAGPGRTRF